jgi:antirestriction protein
VACLSCLNAGRALGKWITAEQAAAEVDAEAITYGGQGEAMTYGGPVIDTLSGASYVGCKRCGGDEWELVDVENTPHGFRELRGFYANAGELAECEDLELVAIFAAWYNAGGYITDLAELIAEHEGRYRGEWSSMRAYAEDYAEETGMLQGLPDHLARYFDFDVLAHDLDMDHYYEGGHVWFAQ